MAKLLTRLGSLGRGDSNSLPSRPRWSEAAWTCRSNLWKMVLARQIQRCRPDGFRATDEAPTTSSSKSARPRRCHAREEVGKLQPSTSADRRDLQPVGSSVRGAATSPGSRSAAHPVAPAAVLHARACGLTRRCSGPAVCAGLQCSPDSSPSSVWPAAEHFFVRPLVLK